MPKSRLYDSYAPNQPFQNQRTADAIGDTLQWSDDQISNLPEPGTNRRRRRGGWQPGQFLQSLMERFNEQPMGMRRAFELQGLGNAPQMMWDQRRLMQGAAAGEITTGGQAFPVPQGAQGPGVTGLSQVAPTMLASRSPELQGKVMSRNRVLRPNMLGSLDSRFAPRGFTPRRTSTKRNINL